MFILLQKILKKPGDPGDPGDYFFKLTDFHFFIFEIKIKINFQKQENRSPGSPGSPEVLSFY